MNQDINTIIRESTFEIQSGRYVYAKVANIPSTGNHFMVSKDADEITVVTKEENLNTVDLVEKNKDFYTLISLNVSVPFYSVGFLATVTNAIAKAGMNILVISTYSKDYILVQENCTEKVKNILLKLGFTLKKIKSK
jgi:hypothetical protein